MNAATGSVSIGGFAGQNGLLNGPGGTISDSHSTGEVTANGDVKIGGLVGFEATGTISNAYATGEVIANGGSQIGGLVGSNSVGTISNAYATGAVLANNGSRVGGLAGVDFGTISNAYSTGEVVANGGSNVGGLVGINLGGGSNITSSFWDVQTSGQGGSAGGSGLTTQQAQNPNTLLGLGFNPNSNIWGIVPFGSYPFLLSQFPTPSASRIGHGGIHGWFMASPTMLDAHAGDRFVYAQSETLTVSPASQTLVYDGQTQTISNVTFTGFVGTDTRANAVSGTVSVTGGSGRNVGSYTATAQGTLASDFGYGFTFGTGALTITPEQLTVAALTESRVYNGTTSSSGTPDSSWRASYSARIRRASPRRSSRRTC